jgi:hypothetical protein
MSLRPLRGAGLSASLFAILAAVSAAPLSAQYFGRQKVQYETFDWREMKTSHFLIHYYPAEVEVTQDAARMAERWYTRLSGIFQHEFDQKPVVLYADHPDFQQTNVIGGLINESTGGVTEGLRTRMIMPFTGSYRDNDHVLGHELVHVFQYDLAASPVGGGLLGFSRLPLWLVEGMAEYLSLGRVDAHTAMWLRDAALRGELPTIEQLTFDTRFFPYRYGQALWAYVAGKWGDRSVTETFRIATNVGFEQALQRTLGVTSGQLSQEWITAIRAAYLPLIEGRQRPQDVGTPILYDPDPGAMNLSPAVSPDGRTVAYFGREDLFTVDLLLADAETGEVIKELSSPQRDQHMDAISFVQGSGGWSSDGSRLAYVVIRGGDSQIEILDVASTDVIRRLEVPGVGAVSDPKFSPDGQFLVFQGMSGGKSDIYVVNVEQGDIRQLTDDRFYDGQPAWSPDGRRIAWATDRATTDFERLTWGEMELAVMDVDTRRFEVLDIFDGVKHIDPQWTPDGSGLYFISDREGISDIYRIDLASGSVFQVTRLATGISGITALSPAISIASETGLLMFSAFENSGNNIYSIDCSQPCGTPVERTPQPRIAAASILPPMGALGGGTVSAYLNDPVTGLPEETEFPTEDYSPSIGLDYLGPPSFGVGASDYGTVLAGGVSAYFGDMLGDHFIGTAIQANGTLKDIGGQALYRNSSRRINWGASVMHLPYLTGFSRFNFVGGNNVQIDNFYDRIFIDQAQAIIYYPFSTSQRLEVQAGVTHYSFDREIHRAIFNQFGQQVTQVEVVDTTAPSPLTFFETSLAYVGDNSFFGFTSPVSGKRFRLEFSPTIGTLSYQTMLADYRSYHFKRPFTFAFRGLHYGRYGSNSDGFADDGTRVLSPLFLGWETFVRGYAQESFTSAECGQANPDPQDLACPAFDRLIGSRIALASIELRVPLIGVEEFGLINFPFLPTELAPFIDVGLAWSTGDEVDFSFARETTGRVPVFSAGVSARVNILGFMVFETYYAYPFQRPDKGGHFGFQIAPGW